MTSAQRGMAMSMLNSLGLEWVGDGSEGNSMPRVESSLSVSLEDISSELVVSQEVSVESSVPVDCNGDFEASLVIVSPAAPLDDSGEHEVDAESSVPLENISGGILLENTVTDTRSPTDVNNNDVLGGKRNMCNVCSKTFRFKGNLKKHMIRKHNGLGKKLPCNICSKVFFSAPDLKEHQNLSHRKQVLKCDLCEKTYRSRTGLMLHKRQHSNTFRYMCPHCGNGYQDKMLFEGHVSKHNGEMLYSCKKCSKPFRYASSMRAHLQVCGMKTGSFACSTCGVLFKRKSYLKAHEEGHKNPERYQCSSCGNVFKYKGSLYKHKKRFCSN